MINLRPPHETLVAIRGTGKREAEARETQEMMASMSRRGAREAARSTGSNTGTMP